MTDDEPKKKKKYRPFLRKKYRRSTRSGEHRPVLLAEVLAALDLKPGQSVADCTVGFAGHSMELLKAVAPDGLLVACDLDPANLEPAREKLEAVGGLFTLHHGNFAGLSNILAAEGAAGVDGLLADLGMSSMQVDDRRRGFSFMRDGPLDMRMDGTRGRTAAELLNTLTTEELAACFRDLLAPLEVLQGRRHLIRLLHPRPQRPPRAQHHYIACLNPVLLNRRNRRSFGNKHPRRPAFSIHPIGIHNRSINRRSLNHRTLGR